MTQRPALNTLLAEKRFDEVEEVWLEALEDPLAGAELLHSATKGLARAGQKSRIQSLAGITESTLRPLSKDLAIARLRWSLLKEAVRAGATPSTPDGFCRLFEDAIRAAYPGTHSLETLLGRVRFREAKEPADGLARIERAEKWLPFEVGRCFTMPGRGAGRVVETNFQLDTVRVDFEKAKGIAVPIGVAAKSLAPIPDGHFLHRKLSDPRALAERALADPPGTLKDLLDSCGRSLTLTEVKEAVQGLVPEDAWTSWWAASRKHPHVVLHGSGKSATVEWSHSADAAEESLFAKFEKGSLKEKLELFRKHGKRSLELQARLAEGLSQAAAQLKGTDPVRAFEIAVLLEKVNGIELPYTAAELVPDPPFPLLAQLSDRLARERLLELFVARYPDRAPAVLAEWFFKEEDLRTLDLIDKRLAELDAESRERMLERLLKSPRSGPRAFLWFGQRAAADESFRARLNPGVVGRLLDAVSWDELGPGRMKVREMFDRTGFVASWLMKQATVEDARQLLEALSRHHELEHHRRDALHAAAEMRFPQLRKTTDLTFFVTPEALERKRQELERILKVEIPENTKGIALAAAEGDLSENFEYKARRDKQQLLSARAGKIQEELTNARALDPGSIDTSEVRPGVRVTLAGKDGARAVTLLGPWDSKPEEGIYSYLSDLGKALLGKIAGEEATVLGERVVVEKIEPWR